jgi:hypothetical protein
VENGQLQQSRARDLETDSETPLPFALYEQRFSRDGRLIAGESRDHEVVVCERTGAPARRSRPNPTAVRQRWPGPATQRVSSSTTHDATRVGGADVGWRSWRRRDGARTSRPVRT